jgi:hypothetical protein
MTLADLLSTLETQGALTTVKDKKTALKYLSSALGYASLEQCPVDAACREEATWGKALETHFAGLATEGRTVSAKSRANVRNNLRKVFSVAKAHGLLTTPLPLVLRTTTATRRDFERQQRATSPYQSTFRPQTGPRHYGLPEAQWPPDIQAGWRDYQARGGLRATTFKGYAGTLRVYLGYVTNVCGRPPAWDDLFDLARLRAFVRWHADRLQRPISVQGRHLASTVVAIAKALEHPASQALADWRNGLQIPEALHSKRTHWVSLRDLEAVADACLAAARAPLVLPSRARHPGRHRATQFQRGLILKILVRIPLRQRNVREMQLGKHLYQEEGAWHLHFRGSDLKIGRRQGRENEYTINLSQDVPDLLPPLEEFLRDHRPRLPHPPGSTLCFLTRYGHPFSDQALWQELATVVARHTGKRFYPHLIRTIWATEFLKKTGDFTTAAVMLGDTLSVVMKTYYYVVYKERHAKAKAFLASALHAG